MSPLPCARVWLVLLFSLLLAQREAAAARPPFGLYLDAAAGLTIFSNYNLGEGGAALCTGVCRTDYKGLGPGLRADLGFRIYSVYLGLETRYSVVFGREQRDLRKFTLHAPQFTFWVGASLPLGRIVAIKTGVGFGGTRFRGRFVELSGATETASKAQLHLDARFGLEFRNPRLFGERVALTVMGIFDWHVLQYGAFQGGVLFGCVVRLWP